MQKWEARNRFGRLHPSLEIGAEGLVLGAGTLLAKTASVARGRPHMAVDEPRVMALLATAYGKPVAPYVVARLRRAASFGTKTKKGSRIFISPTRTSRPAARMRRVSFSSPRNVCPRASLPPSC
ncbi:MAG: hypothetical protein ACREDT_02425 [Methylocella sp.]